MAAHSHLEKCLSPNTCSSALCAAPWWSGLCAHGSYLAFIDQIAQLGLVSLGINAALRELAESGCHLRVVAILLIHQSCLHHDNMVVSQCILGHGVDISVDLGQ